MGSIVCLSHGEAFVAGDGLGEGDVAEVEVVLLGHAVAEGLVDAAADGTQLGEGDDGVGGEGAQDEAGGREGEDGRAQHRVR